MDAVRIYRPAPSNGALRQGEILTDLAQLIPEAIGGEVEYLIRIHPFAIVMSQDCDLDLDYRARLGERPEDKLIPSVLFCEMTTAEDLRQKVKTAKFWERIRTNTDERYQFLQAAEPEADALRTGLPELGVDFKRYFTMVPKEVELRITTDIHFERRTIRAVRRVVLSSPYLEHFSTRFSHYLARIALPEPHSSD